MLPPSHSIHNHTTPTVDTVYGDRMSLGTDLNGVDGKTPIWKMMDRAAWKEQTYYTLQRCPTTTHTYTPNMPTRSTHESHTRTHTHTHTHTHTDESKIFTSKSKS